MPSIQEFIPFKDYMYIGNVNEIDLDKLQVFVDSVYSSDKEGRQFSNRGGWQSNDLYPFQNLYSEHTTFSQLLDCLKSTLFFGLKESTENEFNIEVGNSWININTEGDFNIFHSHPGGIYSSVFYLTDDNSPIMFADLNTARSAFIGFTKTLMFFCVTILSIQRREIIFSSLVIFSIWLNRQSTNVLVLLQIGILKI